ncbi:MAG: N-6 DNA methylase [Acetobacteraceae bacterium]|nr:N-6 DNA methylase [Acetobacteraceae bacterium]
MAAFAEASTRSAPLSRPGGRYRIVTVEKAGGATYTPTELADFVATEIAARADLSRPTLRVLDPAIGNGQLLMSLLSQLQSRSRATVIVVGFDTDPDALRDAERRLRIAFPAVTQNLHHDSFLAFALNRAQSGPSPSRRRPRLEDFDIIIANPPYVRSQILGSREARALASAFGLSGRVDLYHAFLIAMARSLRPGGTAGIIVSNRFMTTRGGGTVRSAMRERFALCHVWDLGDTKLFEAAVLPAILLAEGRNGRDPGSTSFTSIYRTDDPATLAVPDAIAALRGAGTVALPDGRRFRVQHGCLASSANPTDLWRIATSEGDAWLRTVKRHTWDTFKAIGKVRVGVKTCADAVFIRDDWDSLPSSQRPELLRPLTTHHIGSRFRAAPRGNRRLIVYPHDVVDGERQPVDLTQYPNTRRYLERHRATLERRSYVRKAGRRWYEIWVPQDPLAWALPKLVFRDISARATFWIDLDGTVVNGDCYWLAAEGGRAAEWLWLAVAVANSRLIEAFYDLSFNNKLYAGRRRFITQYVEQFPLPDPDSVIARSIVEAAKAIYATHPTSPMEAGVAEIDRLVCRAFGLGAEPPRACTGP